MNDHLADFGSSVQDFAKSKDVAKMGAKQLKDEFAASTIQTQAQNHSLSSTRKILNEYNKGVKAGTKDQTNLTKAVKKGNVALGDYLENLDDGKEASMFGFLAQSAGDTMVDIIGNLGTSLLNAGVSALTSWAISAGVQLIDTLIVTAEEAKKGMSDAFAE